VRRQDLKDVLLIEMAAALLDAMSHPARLRTLLLITEQEWLVGDLAKENGLSQSALSQHLKRLREAKLVRTRRDSQSIYYRCNDPKVLEILAVLGLRSAHPNAAMLT